MKINTKNLGILSLLAVLIVGITLISGCIEQEDQKETPEKKPKTPTETSEQPNEETFNKYFSDVALGKLPPEGEFPQDIQQNVNIFTSGDQICLSGTVVQEVQISTGIYDLETKEFIGEKQAYPKPLQKGGFVSCGSLDLPAGKYECKVYVDDVLVAVLPFEVVEQSKETPAEVPEEIEIEIWLTMGEDPQAKSTTMTSAETKNARVWTKCPKGIDISFQIWITFPDEKKVPYVDDGRTDPAGEPVYCGGFAEAFSPGIYTFEVRIDEKVVGSAILEVTD